MTFDGLVWQRLHRANIRQRTTSGVCAYATGDARDVIDQECLTLPAQEDGKSIAGTHGRRLCATMPISDAGGFLDQNGTFGDMFRENWEDDGMRLSLIHI